MIRVEISKKNNVIESIHCIGHAGYADYGKDIVCASVSSIVITSVNLIYKLNKDIIKVIEDKGLIEINVLKEDKTINMVLKNMIDMLKELSNDYKKNVKII